MQRRKNPMARTRSITSIEAEISKVSSELKQAQGKPMNQNKSWKPFEKVEKACKNC